MEKITTLRVYNLVDANKNRLRLKLGRIDDHSFYDHASYGDKGFRWSFVGTKIPMPVRNGTWFNGFPEHTMLDWLKGNGWYVQTCVDMFTGKANVYELPNGNDDLCVEITPDPELHARYEPTFRRVIRDLVRNANKIDAVRLYRYVHGGTLGDANIAVTEIANED